ISKVAPRWDECLASLPARLGLWCRHLGGDRGRKYDRAPIGGVETIQHSEHIDDADDTNGRALSCRARLLSSPYSPPRGARNLSIAAGSQSRLYQADRRSSR